MIVIDKQNISMTRGDTAPLIFIAQEYDEEEQEYVLFELSEGDKVVFQLGKKYGEPLLTKEKVKADDEETTQADYTIVLLPEDTKPLKNNTEYRYDVAIHTADGDVVTYIGDDGNSKPKFKILNEVGDSNA